VNRSQQNSVAKVVRDRVSRGGVRAWTVADFGSASPAAVTSALHRLAQAGELITVRQGLYWRGRKYAWGMSRPDPLEFAYAVAHSKGGVGWAGLSAANVLGLTTQVPGQDVVAVPTPKPRPMKGMRFVSRVAKAARSSAKLSPLEVSVLEVLTDWLKVIDVSPAAAVEQLAEMISDGDGDVDAVRLVRGAKDESGPARDRLRRVLFAAGRSDLADLLQPSAAKMTTQHALAGIA
jgi:hypothetical protein